MDGKCECVEFFLSGECECGCVKLSVDSAVSGGMPYFPGSCRTGAGLFRTYIQSLIGVHRTRGLYLQSRPKPLGKSGLENSKTSEGSVAARHPFLTGIMSSALLNDLVVAYKERILDRI